MMTCTQDIDGRTCSNLSVWLSLIYSLIYVESMLLICLCFCFTLLSITIRRMPLFVTLLTGGQQGNFVLVLIIIKVLCINPFFSAKHIELLAYLSTINLVKFEINICLTIIAKLSPVVNLVTLMESSIYFSIYLQKSSAGEKSVGLKCIDLIPPVHVVHHKTELLETRKWTKNLYWNESVCSWEHAATRVISTVWVDWSKVRSKIKSIKAQSVNPPATEAY